MTLRRTIGQERNGTSLKDKVTTNAEVGSDCPLNQENCTNQENKTLNVQNPNIYQGAVYGFTMGLWQLTLKHREASVIIALITVVQKYV